MSSVFFKKFGDSEKTGTYMIANEKFITLQFYVFVVY